MFRRRFDLMALQRNLKALGTFGFQTTTRGNPVYIQYIPRTLELRARQPRASSAFRPPARTPRGASARNLRVRIDRLTRECGWTCRHCTIRHLHTSLPRPPAHAATTSCTSPRTGSRPSNCSPRASHFDYTSARAIAELAEWLSDTRLTLHSVHAPIVERMQRGQWVGSFSNASGDETAAKRPSPRRRPRSRSPHRFRFVTSCAPRRADERTAARRRQSAGCRAPQRRGDRDGGRTRVNVRVAVEVIPNALSDAAALAALIEEHSRASTSASASTTVTPT